MAWTLESRVPPYTLPAPANGAETTPRGREARFLKGIHYSYPTLCRRPSSDLLPTVGEPLKTAVLKCRASAVLESRTGGNVTFLQLRAQRATEHPRYRWCGTGSALALLWLRVARLCQPFSWMWLHATAANMDRVCSDALSEHAQPVVHPMRWSEPAGGSRVRGSHHVHRSGRKSPRKGCAGREVHRRSGRAHMREQLGQRKRSRDAARARAAAAVPDPAGPAPTAVSELDTAIGRRPS